MENRVYGKKKEVRILVRWYRTVVDDNRRDFFKVFFFLDILWLLFGVMVIKVEFFVEEICLIIKLGGIVFGLCCDDYRFMSLG